MKKTVLSLLACLATSSALAAGSDKAIGQYVTPVQANESRVIYLYDVPAVHSACGQNKRAAAYYMTGSQAEKLADGCWIMTGEKVTFRLYAPSGAALVTDVAKKDVRFD